MFEGLGVLTVPTAFHLPPFARTQSETTKLSEGSYIFVPHVEKGGHFVVGRRP